MSFSKNIDRYRQIFIELKNPPNFGYKNKQIAELTGLNMSKLSRFFNRKLDLKAGEFFYLLESMPTAFQAEFWQIYNPPRSSVQDLVPAIEAMNLEELGNLLSIIGVELIKRNNP